MSSSAVVTSRESSGLLAKLIGPLPPRVPLGRQLDIDAARGIAILLVVVGHVVSAHGAMPADNNWYVVLRTLIYRFHMPLFMFLTGTSFALSLPHFDGYRSIFRYSIDRFIRLFVPYVLFGSIILLGKLIAAHFIYVDNKPEGSFNDLILLIVNPGESAVGFLWFIYVLGLYFLVIPLLLQLTWRRPIILFLVATAAQAIDWPDVFMLSTAFRNLPFFIGGMLLWLFRTQWKKINLGAAFISVTIFSAGLIISQPLGLSTWFIGMLSVPAVLSISQYIPNRLQVQLVLFGQLSLSIYLMSSVSMGIVKALLLIILPWDSWYFIIYFSMMMISGITAPIVFKKFLGRHFPTLNRFV